MPATHRSRSRFFERFAVAVFALWVASAVGVVLWGQRDTARQADAIVVLGAAQYAGRPSPVLRARLDHAIVLWRRQLAPRLILTGGIGTGDNTAEAAVGRRYVLRRGVPDSAILLEHTGRTTIESLAAVSSIMHDRRMGSAILVSDRFHMLRLDILTRAFGLTPLISPTPTSPIWANRQEAVGYVLSESVKVPFTLLSTLFIR